VSSPDLFHRPINRYPPFAGPGSSVAQAIEPLPAIDDYLDELPSIVDFLVLEPVVPFMDDPRYDDSEVTEVADPALPQSDADGWAAVGGWQSFDWNSISALGQRASEREVADRSWDPEYDSNEGYPEPESGVAGWSEPDHTSAPTADEVAAALDGIARRIRSGELVIDNLHGNPPEAAMAAALAVLLRMRG
jgi:hypothetical protein